MAVENETLPVGTYNSEILSRQELYESNARTYPRRFPLVIEHASGLYVRDMEGRVYMDCLCGAGSLALGHNHPAVIQAIRNVLDREIPLLTLDISTPVKDRFVEDLLSSLPVEFAGNAKVQFCSPSGADAIEAAVKLVKIATGRPGILAFQGSYHGMTNGALSLTSMTRPKKDNPGLMPSVYHLPFPYSYRCPFGLGGDAGEQAILYYIDHLLSDQFSGLPPIAGMLVEVVQGEGGCIPGSDSWIRGLRSVTQKHDIPLIIDEVQAGIGRTGSMYAFERAGITPDVVVISKSIGGSLPLSLIAYDRRYDKWTQGAHVGTFRGNQLAMAAGSAVLAAFKEDNLLENVNMIGGYMMSVLAELAAEFTFIGEVRGRGLMLACEIVDKACEPDSLGSYPTYYKLARTIQAECFKRGLIIELGGREDSTVRFLPPLNITQEQAREILRVFRETLEQIKTSFHLWNS